MHCQEEKMLLNTSLLHYFVLLILLLTRAVEVYKQKIMHHIKNSNSKPIM